MKKLNLYLETSVWGHYYAEDVPENRSITKKLFELIVKKNYEIYISKFVIIEIENAEEREKIKLHNLIKYYSPDELEVTSEVYKLADKYLKTSSLPGNSHTDAMHAAMTSVYEIDILVTWNCRHLARKLNKNKINMVNIRNSYRPILILTPAEVILYEGI